MSRRTVILGALSGFAATLPMTATMSRLHLALPSVERYPLPPRELAEDLPSLAVGTATATLVYHFLYGAAAGALFGGFSRRRDIPAGAAYGIAVWVASYLGWIPASRRLNAATRHPARRNGLMLMAHLVWGGRADRWLAGTGTLASRELFSVDQHRKATEGSTGGP